jgi:hypothetical protein
VSSSISGWLVLPFLECTDCRRVENGNASHYNCVRHIPVPINDDVENDGALDASELRDPRVPRLDAMDDFRRSNVDAENHRDVIVAPDFDAAG